MTSVRRSVVTGIEKHNPHLHYIDPMAVGSPFIGHSLCSSDPYFNGLNVVDRSLSFHPNMKGQRAYAKLITSYRGK